MVGGGVARIRAYVHTHTHTGSKAIVATPKPPPAVPEFVITASGAVVAGAEVAAGKATMGQGGGGGGGGIGAAAAAGIIKAEGMVKTENMVNAQVDMVDNMVKSVNMEGVEIMQPHPAATAALAPPVLHVAQPTPTLPVDVKVEGSTGGNTGENIQGGNVQGVGEGYAILPPETAVVISQPPAGEVNAAQLAAAADTAALRVMDRDAGTLPGPQQ